MPVVSSRFPDPAISFLTAGHYSLIKIVEGAPEKDTLMTMVRIRSWRENETKHRYPAPL